MADTNQGTRAAGNSSPTAKASGKTQGAVPMVQTEISSHSINTTKRAAKNVGKHKHKLYYEQHPVPLVAFIAIAVAVLVSFTLWMTRGPFVTEERPEIQPGQEVTINIPDGSGGGEIAQILYDEGVINDTADFFKEVRNLGAETSMQSGSYSFVTGANVREVVRQLVDGPNSAADSFTIPEGFTLAQVASTVEASLQIPADEFIAQAKASNYVNDYPFLAPAIENGDTLEGFLFPKTYDMGGKIKTADVVIRMMLSQYQSELSEFDIDGALNDIYNRYGVDMSQYDIVVLASIIEKEAYSGDDWVNVSSTFYNRMNSDMPLQSDATMGYVTGGEVTPDDLETDSPYNTYLNDGLPPTPICNPSYQSLKAALYPADTNYHFFLIVEEDGYSFHAFSDTYEEHLEAIEKVDSETA